MIKNHIILIGGPPTVGKSTFAKKLSKEFNIPWISSDFIRGWMKCILKDKKSALFNFEGTTAEKHYKNNSIDKTIHMEQERDKIVFDGIKCFIKKNDDWDSYIIEGISIQPTFINKIKHNSHGIIPIFLLEENIEIIKKVVYERGLWGDADTYSDCVKELEIEYLIKTNQYYLNNLKKLKYKYFLLQENRENTYYEVFEYLKEFII